MFNLFLTNRKLTNCPTVFSKHEKIFIGKPVISELEQIKKEIEMLGVILMGDQTELVEVVVKKLVPGFNRVG